MRPVSPANRNQIRTFLQFDVAEEPSTRSTSQAAVCSLFRRRNSAHPFSSLSRRLRKPWEESFAQPRCALI